MLRSAEERQRNIEDLHDELKTMKRRHTTSIKVTDSCCIYFILLCSKSLVTYTTIKTVSDVQYGCIADIIAGVITAM